MSVLVTKITKENFKDSLLLSRLLTLHDIPKQIYIKGTLPEFTVDEYGLFTPRILTVVGSRKNSFYGKDVIENLLSSLKNKNVIILSGLALGIDGLAHKTALKNKIKTIAIPGSGLGDKIIYPSAHRNLAKEILENGGALLSEFEENETAAQWTFPARNRIMAALSDAVLIIEAEEKSGTLITARQSLELGKEIGAVPGSIFSPNSIGTNSLIKDGAMPITNSNDLFELLKLKKEENNIEINLNENEKIIFDLLVDDFSKDELLIRSNLSQKDFLIAISNLEINGFVEESFGEIRKIK